VIYTGVVFDLGGVVLESPLHAIDGFERAHGLPPGLVNRTIAAAGADGAWARLERGEISGQPFHRALAGEIASAGYQVDTVALMEAVRSALRVRPGMLRAVDRLREEGFAVAACTNNWEPFGPGLVGRFDVFVESVAEGTRKPEPGMYEILLGRLGLPAPELVMLDDLGVNLRAARALGMTTIKVDDPEQALTELGHLLAIRI
jgi:putative hydrolase of the HAD superfamily